MKFETAGHRNSGLVAKRKKSDDLIDLFRPVPKDEDLIADIEFFITTAAYGEPRQAFTFLMKKILISAICTRWLRIMNFPGRYNGRVAGPYVCSANY